MFTYMYMYMYMHRQKGKALHVYSQQTVLEKINTGAVLDGILTHDHQVYEPVLYQLSHRAHSLVPRPLPPEADVATGSKVITRNNYLSVRRERPANEATELTLLVLRTCRWERKVVHCSPRGLVNCSRPQESGHPLQNM